MLSTPYEISNVYSRKGLLMLVGYGTWIFRANCVVSVTAGCIINYSSLFERLAVMIQASTYTRFNKDFSTNL